MLKTLFWSGLMALGLIRHAPAAEIIAPFGGVYVYTQNFDSLYVPEAAGNVQAPQPWSDNVTVPNWWFFYNLTNATGGGTYAGSSLIYFGADGSSAHNLTLNSIGSPSSPDRALGYPTTTSRGEQAAMVVFFNPNNNPVDLTRVRYNGEVRRLNTGSNVTESLFVWYHKGATQAAALSFTTAPVTAAVFPESVATQPNGYYINNWTQVDAARWRYQGAGAGTPVNLSYPIDAANLTGIRILPGEYIAIRWGNINDNFTDALMGIDDVALTFNEVITSVSATASSIVRQTNATPLQPADDTIEFSLLVEGTGLVGPGWTITTPPFTNSGTYGVPKLFASIPISAFSAPDHTARVTVTDPQSGASTIFSVAAPWAVLSPQYYGYTYHDGGTELAGGDDWVTYAATVTGSYTGPSFKVTGLGGSPTVPYGGAVAANVTPGSVQELTFQDSADASVTAALTLNNAAIIGTNTLSGTPRKLLSQPVTGVRRWALNSDTRQMVQSGNNASVDHEILSAEIDLSSVGGVMVTARLESNAGAATGFEENDIFRMDLIIDGRAVSMLGAADIDRDGTLRGSASDGNELAGTTEPNQPRNFEFTGYVPDAAATLQIRITGNTNSAGETLLVKDLTLAPAPPGLHAVLSAATVLHQGTDTPGDDRWRFSASILPVGLGGSTGWISNLTAPDNPLAGNYSGNAVTSSLAPPAAETFRTVQFRDAMNNAMATDLFSVAPPLPALSAVSTAVVRVAGGPGLADDTLLLEFRVAGTNGGPRFKLATDFAGMATANPVITPSLQNHFVTLDAAPTHGTVSVTLTDVSYPAASETLHLAVPPPEVTPGYVLGVKNLGAGVQDLVTAAGPLAVQWVNYPALRTTVNRNGGTTSGTVTGETVSLTGITGAVRFKARLRAIDRSFGFEASDVFFARLILDGNTAVPVNLIAPFDTNNSGFINGGTGAADEFNTSGAPGGGYESAFALSFLIPDHVNSAQLVFGGATDSATEFLVLDEVSFVRADSDGDGMTDEYEQANGLNANSPADKFLDRDQDGENNYQEFLAGTAANDPHSRLRLTAATLNAATGAYAISWTSVAGKGYRIQTSTSLLPGSWVDLSPTIPANGELTTLNGFMAAPVPSRVFFGIRVVP